jgi:hypothetical protein
VSGAFALQKNSFIQEGIAGLWYATGRGPLVVPNGSALRATTENPVGSGKLLLVHRLRVFAASPNEYVHIHINPTTNLPTFVIPSSNRRIGFPNGVAVVKCDVGANMSGGTVLPYQIPLDSSVNTLTEFEIFPTLILPPGTTIGIDFVNDTGGGPRYAVLLADWKEVPA